MANFPPELAVRLPRFEFIPTCHLIALLSLASAPQAQGQQPLVPGGVEVTPDGGTLTASANTTGNLAAFFVTNTSTTTNTYSLTCLVKFNVTCQSVTPPSIQLAPGAESDVEVRYAAGAAGIGHLILRASGAGTDSGNYSVTVQNAGPPTVALRHHNGDNQDRSHCLTVGAGEAAASVCGDLMVTHGLPGYATMGRERSLTLLYNSGTARPRPIVVASVTQTDVAAPSTVFVELEVAGVVSDTATYSGWGSATRQIAISHDAVAVGHATGVYPFTLRVQNKYSGSAFTASVSGNLIVVNRNASEFGAGVWLGGVEQLVFNQPVSTSAGGILRVGADGSAQLYGKVNATTWLAPAGAFRDTLRLSGGLYTRTLRHGVQVTFDAQGRHLRTTNRTGQQTNFHWNPVSARLDSIRVPPANQTGTTYKVLYTSGILDRLIDPAGRILNATVSGGVLASLLDPDGVSTAFGYNTERKLTTRTGRRGFRTRYEYAKSHRLTKVFVPAGPQAGSPDTAVTEFQSWDEKGLAGSTITAVDTAQGYTRVIGPRVGVPDDATFWVDRWGAPVRIAGATNDTTFIVRGDPAFPALVTKVTYPNKRLGLMAYINPRGNLTEVRDSTLHLAGGVGLPTKVTRYVYGNAQHPDSPTEVSDALDRKTKYAYNGLGLTDSIIDPRLHRTKFVFDTVGTYAGLLKSVTERAVQTWRQSDSTELVQNQVNSFTYDVKGNLRTAQSPVGVITSHQRDAYGRVTNTYDPHGTRQGWTYDSLNRVTATVQYTQKQTNPITASPLAGCIVTQVSCGDTVPQPLVPALAATLTSQYTYGAGTLDLVEDARNVPRSYQYDARGLLRQETDEFQRSRLSFYDRAGLLDSTRSRSLRMVRYRYDEAGRRTQMSYPFTIDSTGCSGQQSCYDVHTVPGDTIDYTYDVMGNQLLATKRDETISRTYFADGSIKRQITAVTGVLPDTLFFTYDATGARTRVIRGQAVRDTTFYRYNEQSGDLDTLEVRWEGLTTLYRVRFQYDGLGRRRLVTYPNGMSVALRYDAAGSLRRVTSSNPANSASDIFDFTSRREFANPVGQVTRESITCSAAISRGNACGPNESRLTKLNRYSRLDMLVGYDQFNVPNINVKKDSMGYDASANMVFWRDGVAAIRHQFGTAAGAAGASSNRLLSDTLSAMTYSFNWDGARLHESSPRDQFLTRHYYYDGLGRMSGYIAWATINGDLVGNDLPLACVYNPEGKLSRPCENLGHRMAFDGHNAASTLRTAGAPVWRFVHGPGLDDPVIGLYRVSTTRKVFYWVTDGQGRHFAFGDSLGMLSATEHDTWYGAQGGKHAGGISSANTFKPDRSGTPYIPGVSFFRNRAYDQQTGRWTQEDPIGVAGGLNLYQFNGNNPVAYTDPFGLSPWGKLISLGLRGFKTLTKGLDRDQMVDAVRSGEDVLAPNRGAAREVAQAAGDGHRPIGPEIHGSREAGYRSHYHTHDRSGGHVFYSVAAALTASHYAKDSGPVVQAGAAVVDFFNPLSIGQDILDIKDLLTGADQTAAPPEREGQ